MPKKVLFVIQYDSFLKTFLPVIPLLKKRGVEVEILLYRPILKKNWITQNLLMLLEGMSYTIGFYPHVRSRCRKTYDAIVVGTANLSILHKIRKDIERKNLNTKLITGYIGALLNNNPYGFKKGVQRRHDSDLICVPGSDAAKAIEATGLIDASRTKVAITGIPRFDALYNECRSWAENSQKCILFLEQPTFPESKHERLDLAKKIIAIAHHFPDHTVLLKPRFSEKVGHAHRPRFLLQNFLKTLETPPNFALTYDDLYSLFPHTSMALTISSTAGIEALLVGIPTYFISDYCGKENRYGSNDFQHCGAVITFEQLFRKEFPTILYDEVQHMMLFDGQSTEHYVQEILTLIESHPHA